MRLATEVFLGDPARFAERKALASYVGMIPREYSSGGRQRLGGLSKQGNPLLRFCGVRRERMLHARIQSCSVLPPQISTEGPGEGECGRGSQARNPTVDHVAGSD